MPKGIGSALPVIIIGSTGSFPIEVVIVGGIAPYNGTPLGYQQITDLSSAVGLPSIPATATYAVITIEGNIARWRDDGTDPTATVGMPVTPFGGLLYSANLSAIKFIQAASGAILNVSYYK